MVLAIVIGPTFIEWLRRTGVGQQIREEGPARHIVKQGTPTMGGLLILATAVVPFLVLSRYTLPGLTLLLPGQVLRWTPPAINFGADTTRTLPAFAVRAWDGQVLSVGAPTPEALVAFMLMAGVDFELLDAQELRPQLRTVARRLSRALA